MSVPQTGNVVRLETAPGDDVLIARVALKDEAAFGLMSERYSGLIFSIAYRMLNNRSAAEDMVQDVLFKLWNFAGDWQVEKGASVKTWLCRITGNACIDGLRKKKPLSIDDVPEMEDTTQNAEGDLRTRETGAIVGRALQDLPERQRLALVMFHYEEMSVIDIAGVLKITPKAAEGLLTRGRLSLRQSLAAYKGVL
ncbi:MAG: polymerase [Micavibrio sp.]|nr:polymerase [Micavibrio sp.]